MNKVIIYTKGICKAMTGKDGVYAAMLTYKDSKKMITGHVEFSTPHQIELIAILEALQTLNASGKSKAIEIQTHSDYVVHGFNDNLQSWIDNNWKTTKKKPIKNKAQWKALAKSREFFPGLSIIKALKSPYMTAVLEEASAKRKECELLGANV